MQNQVKNSAVVRDVDGVAVPHVESVEAAEMSDSISEKEARAREESTSSTYSQAPIQAVAKKNTEMEELKSMTTVQPGELDDPFGDAAEGGTNYKSLSWWRCGALLVAETISLGILSLPKVVATVGFVPGVLIIAGLGILATYTGYVVYQFKMKHMGMHSFANAAEYIGGPITREVVEVMQVLILIFIMAAHILTFTVEMNVLTNHALCTIVFGIIGTVVSFVLTLPRTFKNISLMSVISCISITAAILITMICVGIKHPAHPEIHAVTPSSQSSFQKGAVSVSNIVVAYAGHVAFFGFISEMKKPTDFPKALCLLQTVAISFYITVAVVIYRYVGSDVPSPALTAASPTVAKVAWGVAMPTIIIAGVVNGAIVVKNMFVRIWRDWKKDRAVITEKSLRSWGTWVALCAVAWILAWVIASAIPVFSDLLGLLGALFCSWFTLGLPAILWFQMNKGLWFRDWKKISLFCLNVVILVICCVVCVAGVYGSAVGLANKESGKQSAFSCADNSGTGH